MGADAMRLVHVINAPMHAGDEDSADTCLGLAASVCVLHRSKLEDVTRMMSGRNVRRSRMQGHVCSEKAYSISNRGLAAQSTTWSAEKKR
jgi:hypothetical protein